MIDLPAWMITAKALVGTDEYAGGADNPSIIAWAAEIGRCYPEMATYAAQYKHDEIAWCGLFVAYCCAKNGIRPPFGPTDTDRFLWAQSWKQVAGEPMLPPRPGAIVVFPHHVAFFDHDIGDGRWAMLGGNQSDSVTVAPFRADSAQAVIWPDVAKLAEPAKRQTGITATVFGGQGDPNRSAYDGHFIDDDERGVALPYRFSGERPKVRVTRGDKSVVCDVIDVGPWNTNDPYWQQGARPQAETGTDRTGRKTNRAGIDLTPAAAAAIGLDGKGLVDWEFATEAAGEPNQRSAPEVIPPENTRVDVALARIRPILEELLAVPQVPATTNDTLADLLAELAKRLDKSVPPTDPQKPVLERLDGATSGWKTIIGTAGTLFTWFGGQYAGLGPEVQSLLIAGFGTLTAVGISAKIDRGIATVRAAMALYAKVQQIDAQK